MSPAARRRLFAERVRVCVSGRPGLTGTCVCRATQPGDWGAQIGTASQPAGAATNLLPLASGFAPG
jgi:hypothetical protein